MNSQSHGSEDRLEAATAARLARLRSMPVDTSRLDAALRREIAAADPGETGESRVIRFLRPMRALAASIVILFTLIGVLLYSAATPVSASAQTMAQLHYDLVSGRTPVTQVDSMQAAERALAEQWPQGPDLPEMDNQHVMACCMKSVQHKRVACVLLKGESAPVTMTVAKASDMKSPPGGKVVTRDGMGYHVTSAGDLNMVSCQRDGRYVCLISSLPTDRLIELASQLRF